VLEHVLPQVAALDIFHGEVGLPGDLAVFVDGDDAVVLQPGDGLGLAREALAVLARGEAAVE